MSVETKLRTALTGDSDVASVVGTRVYLANAPQSAERPFVVFYRSGGSQLKTMDGPSGTGNPQYEVVSVADTIATAKTLGGYVAAALDGLTSKASSPYIDDCNLIDESDGMIPSAEDENIGQMTVTQTYSLWTST